MQDKLFFFPQCPRDGDSPNPYSQNYKEALQKYFDVVDKDVRQSGIKAWGLLKYSAKADIYVLNWLESIPFMRFGLIQLFLVMIALMTLKLRRAKIIWMFHNIRPHQGENWMTHCISSWLYKNSTLIVSHSQEAAEYASQRAKCKVIYKCHPVMPIDVAPRQEIVEPFDVFIWGAILPYKGIVEFVSLPEILKSNLKVKIIGTCKDKELEKKIRHYTDSHIFYDNRCADFAEISANCRAAKYVLFPYVGKCVSSSGALIDTIALGGTPVGPNVGAFRDLASENVCITYRNYEELIKILNSEKKNMVDPSNFISNNSWDKFAGDIYNMTKSLLIKR